MTTSNTTSLEDPADFPFSSSIYDLDPTYNGELRAAIHQSRQRNDSYRTEHLYGIMNIELLRRYYELLAIAKKDTRRTTLLPFLEKEHIASLKHRINSTCAEPEYSFAVILIALNRHYGYKTKVYEDSYIAQEEVDHFGRVVPAGVVLNIWLSSPKENMLYAATLQAVTHLIREVTTIYAGMVPKDSKRACAWFHQLTLLLPDLDNHFAGKKRTTAQQQVIDERRRVHEALKDNGTGVLSPLKPISKKKESHPRTVK